MKDFHQYYFVTLNGWLSLPTKSFWNNLILNIPFLDQGPWLNVNYTKTCTRKDKCFRVE